YRIHGTDAPWTIGSNVSRGCIRMHNEHVIELYKRVQPGMQVTATWKRYPTRTLRGGGVQPNDFFSTSGCN
ncbi:MAG: L,D-transpeptidase, partial [Boseongicola sp.]